MALNVAISQIYLRRGVTVLQVSLDLDRTRLDKTHLFCFGCPPLLYKNQGLCPSQDHPNLPKRYLPNTTMNSSNSNSLSPVKERRRTPMACTNCRSRKLKVSKPFSKVSYPCSHYPSVVQSDQLIAPLVSDVSKTEFTVNIAPSTQV